MSNDLAKETSPYLLQHSKNPVDWYPWGEEALTLARTQNKPILLSIGYSACHWCHVMAQESFEDETVASVMNQHFVNIKVDREERPDIDQIYQTAHNMLNQRNGGWPLTMFLTPEQKPFFGGTYFPKITRNGMPGFLDLLPLIAEAYYTRGEEIEQQNARLMHLFDASLPEDTTSDPEFSVQLFDQALKALNKNFDSVNGGFGNAPKFIHPAELEFCLQRYFVDKDKDALNIVTYTLEKMAKGGIYDQLGGGFCRYSTDQCWHIPHFEKMLYDNGALLHLYTMAWLITRNTLFKQVIEETAAWTMREMQSASGAERGYYSSLDADSEHEEGKFYVWDREHAAQVLSRAEYEIAAPYYGLERPPNFEQKYWNLEISQSLAVVAQQAGVCYEEAQHRLTSAQKKLFLVRETRTRPGRDEKILTSWNGLMIKGMVCSGRIFKHRAWIFSAIDAVDFIRNTMWKNNRLLATYKDGRAHLNAYLDDYVFLLDGLLEMLQTEFRQIDLDFAVALADVLLDQFEDKKAGGFFFTSHDHEALIHRPKPIHDSAIRSGNGVAVLVLQRLGHILGEYRYLQAAERALCLFYPAIANHPNASCSLLLAIQEKIAPPQTVILRGCEPGLSEWRDKLQESLPDLQVFALLSELSGLPAILDKPVPSDDGVNAWVCQGVNCLPEITGLQDLLHVCEVQGKITPLL